MKCKTEAAQYALGVVMGGVYLVCNSDYGVSAQHEFQDTISRSHPNYHCNSTDLVMVLMLLLITAYVEYKH